jgi:hypothetical protein
MGWVSYLEDIKDRLASDLEVLEKSLATGIDQRRPVDIEAVRKWITTAQSLLRRLQANIELATDPAIDLVDRLADAERTNDALRAELASLKAEHAQQLEAALHEESLKHETAFRNLREECRVAGLARDRAMATAKLEREEREKVEQRLQEVLETPRSDLYDRYSDRQAIRDLKPDP